MFRPPLGLVRSWVVRPAASFLRPSLEQLLVGDGHALGARVVDHDGLEALGAHHGAQAAAASVAAGAILQVVEADAGRGHLHLTGGTDAADATLPVLRHERIGGRVRALARQVVRRRRGGHRPC